MQGEESETSSSVDVQVSSLGGGGGGGGAGDKRGKHRILAELKRLEQETRSLEEELEELERMDPVSVACEELLLKIETRPDPLLPVTNGPPNPSWDRWFEGPQESRGCRCWVL
ncbi:guanine nucleotide-binding protein subunit gamma 1-like protein [Cinnamomum micranthum f. kanehirae]|uniref:Guanine nucleotide-binding protein subunit gamma 1-like protein n=1 Tax=Cinnamomum micranthum f. kanehirae TaxID=337451 RepID=A0A443PDJ3_9MAGN|nr:guanine nucleotide-binding protein subunit gamma 1-like protein [Cinnamomum micranthum f. kanehirae]